MAEPHFAHLFAGIMLVPDISWECHPSGRGRHRCYIVEAFWNQAGFRWHHMNRLHFEHGHAVRRGETARFDDAMDDVIDEIRASQRRIADGKGKPDPGLNR